MGVIINCDESMSKLERNRQRITQRIDDKQYYEAQQQIRTLATRQIKAKDYDGAVDLLFTGSKALLEAGQGGSGADLALFLLEVFRMSERHCDGSSRALIMQLAGSYPQGDPLRRRFTSEAIRWSCDDAHPLGDAELHHFFGSLYIKGLIIDCWDSCKIMRGSKLRSTCFWGPKKVQQYWHSLCLNGTKRTRSTRRQYTLLV